MKIKKEFKIKKLTHEVLLIVSSPIPNPRTQFVLLLLSIVFNFKILNLFLKLLKKKNQKK